MSDSRPPSEAEDAKNLAEAEKARAEAEAALINARANAAKLAAEARLASAEAEDAELKLLKGRNDRDREREKREEELAGHKYHHVYLFDKEVTEGSVKECIRQLVTWERTASEPITVELVIDSPGGSVFDGFSLVDHVAGMHQRGHTVNTTALGMAASMGGVMLMIGKKRRMGANSMLLIHEIAFGAMGSMGKIEDQVALAEKLQDRIASLFAARSNLSKAKIRRMQRRKDLWLDSDECVKYGLVDEVISYDYGTA